MLGWALVTVLNTMVADGPHEPLALFELYLESNRNPYLRRLLSDTFHSRRDLIVRQCRVAGIAITEQDAMLLEMSVLGILFTALTTGAPNGPGTSIRAVTQAVLDRYAHTGE